MQEISGRSAGRHWIWTMNMSAYIVPSCVWVCLGLVKLVIILLCNLIAYRITILVAVGASWWRPWRTWCPDQTVRCWRRRRSVGIPCVIRWWMVIFRVCVYQSRLPVFYLGRVGPMHEQKTPSHQRHIFILMSYVTRFSRAIICCCSTPIHQDSYLVGNNRPWEEATSQFFSCSFGLDHSVCLRSGCFCS